MNLGTSVASVQLEHPVMNAAGTAKTLADVRRLASSAAAAIMVGSITYEPRAGNSGTTFWPSSEFTLNALGLPNRGFSYYKSTLREMVSVSHNAGKPLFVSVVGFTPSEYAGLALFAAECGADLIEVNLGCPNVWEDGKQKRIPSFDPDMIVHILSDVCGALGNSVAVSAKLSPHSDPSSLVKVARIIGFFKARIAITTSNTFPNAYFEKEGKSVISGEGFAGLSGPPLLPIGLGQVRQISSVLPKGVDVIGVGGISRGEHVSLYLNAGARACQIGTAYLSEGEKIFSRILQEFFEKEGV